MRTSLVMLIVVSAVVISSACGGESSTAAEVYLDLNHNGQHDPAEPLQDTSSTSGVFDFTSLGGVRSSGRNCFALPSMSRHPDGGSGLVRAARRSAIAPKPVASSAFTPTSPRSSAPSSNSKASTIY